MRRAPLNVATGRLVLYEDGDGDEALDLVDAPDARAVDAIVGPSGTLLVVFLEEMLPPGATVWIPDTSYAPEPPDGWEIPAEVLSPGLSLLLVPRPNVFVRGRPTAVEVAGRTSALALARADDPYLAGLACRWRVRTAAGGDVEERGVVDVDEIPWGARRLHVACAPDGRRLRFHARLEPTQTNPCGVIREREQIGEAVLADGASAPPHWPCLP